MTDKKDYTASPVYTHLCECARRGTRLTNAELEQMVRLVEDSLPGFFGQMAQWYHLLSYAEYHTCLLLRLGFRVKETAMMLGVSSPFASRLCGGIMQRLFGEDGTCKDLKKRLEEAGL